MQRHEQFERHDMETEERTQEHSPHVVRFYGMLKIPSGMIEILIGKIKRSFLAASLLGVSAATTEENSGG
jgi:hypothetical protein